MRGSSRLMAGLFKASMVALATTGVYQNREELQQGYRDAQKWAETSGVSAKVLDFTAGLKSMPAEDLDANELARVTFKPF
ncbi:MAG: hypothetical protein P1U34_00790 [Coxiellaceae bacterium]|nr:hypothetical protein [Coxiellaceae bacterium]